jgi:hypothetical protein
VRGNACEEEKSSSGKNERKNQQLFILWTPLTSVGFRVMLNDLHFLKEVTQWEK